MYNIVLVDDHQVVLESFANLLATSDRFRVVGTAQYESDLFHILEQNHLNGQVVNVLVTDMLMPNLNILKLVSSVKAKYRNVAILVLSGSDDVGMIRQVKQAGASGYVTKTADKAELFDAILAVAAGRQYMDSRVFAMQEMPSASSMDDLLTDRETQIVSLILDELSSNQIAERLFISFNTVETHRKRIYQKLGVTTSLGLMKRSLSRAFSR
ncbi:response regulator [Spirosoma endbachense]|uniref:Response regulator n=1 Tax=Spirosoma endbachense TaxID=2666025 RepID=A0A6P1W6Z1_9BACT|nr:response regulator transcription factor [Spirosoma endbachense]QHW00133.1 response regulator [Spirosoma endbachense]